MKFECSNTLAIPTHRALTGKVFNKLTLILATMFCNAFSVTLLTTPVILG